MTIIFKKKEVPDMMQQTQGKLFNPVTLVFLTCAKYVRQLDRAVHLRMDENAQTITACTDETRIDAF